MSESPNAQPNLEIDFISAVQTARLRVPPEKEYFASAFAAVFYLSILLNGDHILDALPTVLSSALNSQSAQIGLEIATVFAAVGVIDGASRIANERLPLVRAYIHVFILNK